MKLLLALITTVFLYSFASYKVSAQKVPEPPQSFDTDLRQIRLNAVPTFHYTYDDWLQYSPAAAMVGMKAFGYKSRSSWGRMLVSDAFSTAIMFGAVNGVKYTARRLRPDGTSRNSFPSGHTATAFMAATMLHKEYGWRSPWFSVGGYAAATVTGVSRMLNNRHWMSDVAAGAVIGIGSVHLGYFLADLIFKDRQLYDGYEKPEFHYDRAKRYYNAGVFFGRRFLLGKPWSNIRSSAVGISVDIPIIPRFGMGAAVIAGSITQKSAAVNPSGSMSGNGGGNSYNHYGALCGPYYAFPFAKFLETGARVMAGYGWHKEGHGEQMLAGVYLSVITGNNFKIKAFADYETLRLQGQKPYAHSVLVGYSASVCW